MKNMFYTITVAIAAQSKLKKTRNYIQHGNTTCLLHCIAVAFYCYKVSCKFRFLNLHNQELIRGALLHDYFLYDWHLPDKCRQLHGTHHPIIACQNAQKDFLLSEREKDIISKHMFPLTLSIPKYKESVLVCIVDKICSLVETIRKSPYKNSQIRLLYRVIK